MREGNGENKRNKTRGRETTGFKGHGGWRRSKEGWRGKMQDVIRC